MERITTENMGLPDNRSIRAVNRISAVGMCLWTLAIIISLLVLASHGRESAVELAKNQTRLSLEKDMVYRRWAAMHGGVYVPVTDQTPPNPYLKNVRERDIITPSGRRLTLMNPAYMTRQVFDVGKETYGLRGHITSQNPLRPENLPDPWEQQTLNMFKQGKVTEYTAISNIDGEPYLRYMRAMTTENSCLKCHAPQGYQVGDLRGGISISAPLAMFTRHQQKQFQTMAAGHGVIWILGLGIILVARNRLASGIRRETEAILQLDATQHQLIQQEKMASIGQLAAGVAHEINNPIGFISSNLTSLSRYSERINEYLAALHSSSPDGTDKEKLAQLRQRLKIDHIINDMGQLVAESQEGAERVRRIVADLKSFSRAEDSQPAWVNLNEQLESSINIAWNEIKYVAEVVREYGEIPQINCIPQQLNQVFLNLLINASHAIEGRGIITVSSQLTQKHVVVSISDTGKGILPEHLGRVFDPFFTTKEVGKGTGLGLSISYEIIKKHGGEITVTSEPGKGTCFTIRLPLGGMPANGAAHEA